MGKMSYNKNDKKLLLKKYLANLKVNVIIAAYTHCPPTWREIDYIPQYNKFYYICEGEGWIKIKNQKFYPKPGQMFLMPAGTLQSYSVLNKNTFVKYWCHFTACIGDVNLFDIVKVPYFINVRNQKRLKSLFDKLIENYRSEELASPLQLNAAMLEIIAYFLESTPLEEIHLSTFSSIEKLNYVISYIENHLSENITVEQLARIVHFHPNYFIKFFRQQLGISPIHYINKRRLEKAKNLLETTDMTVTEISNRSGFNDVYYFSKIFKKYTGFSPSEFREIRPKEAF